MSKSKTMVDQYYEWLTDIINVHRSEDSYWLLARDLHRREFYWTVPNDGNRANDGINLRYTFAYEYDYRECDEIEGPCSMLEMLVALAMRINESMEDSTPALRRMSEHEQISKWFWEMIKNAGLDKFTDEAYHDLIGNIRIEQIVDDILDRNYRRNGEGGLFPIKYTKKDQRRVEIWYQMSEYLNERYYISDKNL